MIKHFRTLLLVLLCFSAYNSEAQKIWKPAYVITLNNDTLMGSIQEKGDASLRKECFFKKEGSKEVTRYAPENIRSYCMAGARLFEAQKINHTQAEEEVFLEVLLKGKVNLYYDRNDKKNCFYIARNDSGLVLLSNDINPTNFDSDFNNSLQLGKIYFTGSSPYIVELAQFFSDNKKIENAVPSVKYKKKPLVNLTKTYIHESYKPDASISFEKNLKRGVSFGFYAGVQWTQLNFINYIDRGDSLHLSPDEPELVELNLKSEPFPAFSVGGFVNIPISVLNKRLSFQTGVLFNSMQHDEMLRTQDLDTNVVIQAISLGIPMALKYTLSMGKFRPFIGVGKETSVVLSSNVTFGENDKMRLHPFQKGGWFFELGSTYMLSPSLNLYTNLRAQSHYNLIVDEDQRPTGFKDAEEYLNYQAKYKRNYVSLNVGISF